MTPIVAAAIVLAVLGAGQAYAYQWYMIDESNMCDNCIPVEPNPFVQGNYPVHILKAGEQPSFYNYDCWGCSYSDYSKIFDQTGLWYWPQDHN